MFMKIVLYPNLLKKNALQTALSVCDKLNELNADIFIPDTYMDEFSSKPFVIYGNTEEIIRNCGIMIAIGGDGTILKASSYSSEYDIPLLGINTGRLGFMASMESDETDNLSRLISNDYTIEKRMMIDIKHIKPDGSYETSHALNDIAVSRSYSKLTDYDIYTDGVLVSSVRGDGVIFSTPTGSTAYALSAGGPILEPHTECIQFTPVCPHSLFSRTMIFSADRVLELKHYAEDSVYFSVDGMTNSALTVDDRLIISKSEKYLRLIDIKGNSFFNAVNNKLMNAIK